MHLTIQVFPDVVSMACLFEFVGGLKKTKLCDCWELSRNYYPFLITILPFLAIWELVLPQHSLPAWVKIGLLLIKGASAFYM